MKKIVPTIVLAGLAILFVLITGCAPAVANRSTSPTPVLLEKTVTLAPPLETPTVTDPTQPDAVGAARRALANQLGLTEEQVMLVGFGEMTWTNGCLDLAQPGEICTAALVPGYWVRLQYEERYYEFHTNLTGSLLRLAPEEVDQGPGPPSDVTITWHREGGIAGFCDDVTIHLTGEVLVNRCGGSQPSAPLRAWLSLDQRQTLAAWAASLASFNLETSTPATADALSESLTFTGTGTLAAGEAEIRLMSDLASQLVNLAAVPIDPAQMHAARQALQEYFERMNATDYTGATARFGGSYEPLAGMNPEIAPDAHAALFEAACTTNGYRCDLKIAAVTDTYPMDADGLRFVVQLANPDGSPFVLGPCCGADPDVTPPVSEFAYEVYRIAARYLVMELPVFVP